MNIAIKKTLWILTLLLLIGTMSVTASAEWKKNSSGKYVFYDTSGKALSGTYVESEEAGLVKKGSAFYCYRKDGSAYKGFLTLSNGKKYYANSKGQVIINKWIKVKSKVYRSGTDGTLYLGKVVKIGANSYGFNKSGVRLYGKQKFGKNYYFFKKNSGKMAVKTHIVSGGDRYYATKNGTLAVKKWVGRYYFGKTGKALKNGWVDDRYVDSEGKYLTGLRHIGNYYYYFDKTTGKKLVNTTKVVNGYTFTFDGEGKSQGGDSRYETQYYTDPVVSDEELLATIIYCESGNQPYYGQLAVGIVITNRVRSSQFPNTIKGVVYAKQQFEPARTGVLTRYLNNPGVIPETTRKAAKKVLEMYKAGKYTITVEKKKLDMSGYLFFMTPAAYARQGLSSEYIRLEGHVFFKNWSR